ncbi:MAG TPA: NAD(P)-binding domain-containing protein [Solirubrobacteraceae bacterium]|nr:NAD(P)-binding domain-containing protein [Solirubrobacteraceae bacterium]
MRIAVLGTGVVGRTLASALLSNGHEVRLGSRAAGNQAAVAWAEEIGGPASEGTFADAAGFGELVINATAGAASLQALEMAGAEQLAGKVLIDVANPLEASRGMPPTLTVCNDDSLGEQIQRALPDVRVVKTLNTVTAAVMVDPTLVGGPHTIFVAGDNVEAKAQARELLQELGWPAASILDLGDITAARGMEMYLALWLRLWGATGTAILNVEVRRGDDAAS